MLYRHSYFHQQRNWDNFQTRLPKGLEILDMQIKKKGFPFDDSSELLVEEIKENLLNKLLFLKSDLNESTLNEYLLDLTKKAFGKFYGLKPEIMAHTSII